MDFADALCLKGASTFETPTVNPLLDRDVRLGFKLQVAFVRILTVVIVECALDIHRMGVMSLNEIRVVAVHRPNEFSEGLEQAFRQASTKPGGLLGKVESNVRQLSTMARAFPNEEWLHLCDGFAPIDQFNVRFHGHIEYLIIYLCIIFLLCFIS